MAQTILERREQSHVLRLNEKLDALYPAVQRWFEQGREFFLHGMVIRCGRNRWQQAADIAVHRHDVRLIAL